MPDPRRPRRSGSLDDLRDWRIGRSSSVTTRKRPRTSREHRFYLAADLTSHDLDGERWRWYDRYRYPIVQFRLRGRGTQLGLCRHLTPSRGEEGRR
jgi:hypothetical protein